MSKTVATSTFQKKEKEKNEFVKNLNKVKQNQENLDHKLKKVPFDKKNQNINLMVKSRLPKTLSEIEENEELVRLLLKNPKEMTMEEKVYIGSFDDKEFARFIEFLKLKNKEIRWRGNDWGSGHYLEQYIDIYREYGHTENVK